MRHKRDASERDYVTTEEVAAKLGKHAATIRRWCKQGKLPYKRIDKEYLIPKTVFEA